MINIDYAKQNEMTIDEYHNTSEYIKYRKKYELFQKLGLLYDYDQEIDPRKVKWHPSNYSSYVELCEDRDKARMIYAKTGEIPQELADKLYLAYQEELKGIEKIN